MDNWFESSHSDSASVQSNWGIVNLTQGDNYEQTD